jgi:hypothetical protein
MFLDEEPRWNYSLVIPITNPPAYFSKRRILERPQLVRDIMPLSLRGSSSVPCLIATALILLFLISPVMLMRWKPSSSVIFPLRGVRLYVISNDIESSVITDDMFIVITIPNGSRKWCSATRLHAINVFVRRN